MALTLASESQLTHPQSAGDDNITRNYTRGLLGDLDADTVFTSFSSCVGQSSVGRSLCVSVLVTPSTLTLWDPTDYSPIRLLGP